MEIKEEELSEDYQSHPIKTLSSLSLSQNNSEYNVNSKNLNSKRISSSSSGKTHFVLKSQGSDKDIIEYGDDYGISHATIKSSSKRSNTGSEHSKLWNCKIRKNKINQSPKAECSNEDQDVHRSQEKSETDETSEEDREETVIETSFDETSFNTSMYSDRGNDSSSEISVDPVIWKKFKFLSSILKETQHNLRAMDNLILEHRRLQDLVNIKADESREHTIVSHITIPVQQGLGDGEPKTDEAKLEEILSLLHNLTHTLSSYEQHPLLASTHQSPGAVSTHHSLGSTYHGHLQQTSNFPEIKIMDNDASQSYSHIHNMMKTEQEKHAYDSHLPLHSQSVPPSLWQGSSNNNEGLVNKSNNRHDSAEKECNIVEVSTSHSDTVSRSSASYINGVLHHDPTYTNVELLGVQYEPTTSTYPDYIAHCSTSEVNTEKSPYDSDIHLILSDTSECYKPFVKETTNTDSFYCYTGHHSEKLDSLQSQDITHPWTKETRSLRKDIDNIVIRKQALDSRLQSLIAHRAAQRELELQKLESSKEKHLRLIRSHSLEEVDNRKLKGKIKKYKTRSKSYEEKPHFQRKSGTSVCDTYLSMINEDQDEFPSLTMDSTENEEKITELKNDEADLPGLGDSGLSSEINSINATIQELVRENHQLHKFLQGMTCESILKVDQEKLALESKIRLLSEENQALKVSLNEDENADTGGETKEINKSVSFLIAENIDEPEENALNIKTVKSNQVNTADSINNLTQISVSHSSSNSANQIPTITVAESQKTHKQEKAFSHATDQSLVEVEEVLSDTGTQYQFEVGLTSSLKDEVEQLAQENLKLQKLIEEEKKINEQRQKQLEVNLTREETKREAKETQTDLKDDDCNDEMDSSKEMEKLQMKIKKLMEDKEKLNYKLSEEVSERDLESARLEARIRLLSEQNQTLTEKLNEVTVQSKIETEDKSCQSKLGCHHADLIINDNDSESILAVTVRSICNDDTQAEAATGVIDSVTSRKYDGIANSIGVSDTASSELMDACARGSTTMKITDMTPFITDTVKTDSDRITAETDQKLCTHSESSLDVNEAGSATNYSNSPRMSIANKMFDETVSASKADHHLAMFTDYPFVNPDNISPNAKNHCTVLLDKNTACVQIDSADLTYNQDTRVDTKLILQISELLKQNEAIVHGLNDLKSSALSSETNLESSLMKAIDKYGKIIQNIDEKLTSAKSSDKYECESSLKKLTRENQELTNILEQHEEKIQLIIDQNSSLERKLQFAQAESREMYRVGEEKEGSCSTSPLQMFIDSQSTCQNVQINKKNDLLPSEPNQDSVSSIESCKNVTVVRKEITDSSVKSEISLVLEIQDQFSTQSQSFDPLDNSHCQENKICNSSAMPVSNQEKPQSSTWGSAMEGGISKIKNRENGQVSGHFTLALQQEKENWTQLLEQAENEKQILQERIITLVSENDCLAARLEEVVGMSRSLSEQMHSAKKQLVNLTTEKESLQKRVRSLEDGKEDSSLSLTDSVGSTRVTQRLRERTRSLQSEVEQAWQEVHQRTMERDKASAEKVSLECTYSINLNTARREIDALKSQVTALENENDKKSVELKNTQNELEKKSTDFRAIQDGNVSQWERLMEADRKLEILQNELRKGQEQLQNEKDERKGQLQQEQLRSRLLEAADHESSARILILQRSIRETIEAHEALQAKYNQLRTAYRTKKVEKIRHRELSQQYTAQVKELGKTSAALEENFKVMLSTLGENIDVVVGILTSHVFLSPCVVHPGPDLRLDPEAWFVAQQARLRWLQTQLRKLCLHSWKTADLPKTSNFGTTTSESPIKETYFSTFTDVTKSPCSKDAGDKESSCTTQASEICKTVKNLSELSILDESRSYAITPPKKANMPSVSFNASLSYSESPCTEKRPTSEPLHTLKKSQVMVNPSPDISHFSRSSRSLNDAERILTSQQRELSEAKYRQYKALINTLQRDLEYPLVISPSIPSSMITTPEMMSAHYHDSADESEQNSEVSTSEMQVSQASLSRTLVSPLEAEDSSHSQSLSLKVKDLSITIKHASESPSLGNNTVSSESKASSEGKNSSLKVELPLQENQNNSLDPMMSSSHTECEKGNSNLQVNKLGGFENAGKLKDCLKEERASHGLDSDKDKDSWDEKDEDIFLALIKSEVDDHDLF
ncbi:uncharacterized protein [Cherax quadricarinatus]|uniref:uncharacterized protein isoform X2 n=1 Tax=Cherax quadricarinatus TaxID=27406 RepID=UPI00387ED70B